LDRVRTRHDSESLSLIAAFLADAGPGEGGIRLARKLFFACKHLVASHGRWLKGMDENLAKIDWESGLWADLEEFRRSRTELRARLPEPPSRFKGESLEAFAREYVSVLADVDDPMERKILHENLRDIIWDRHHYYHEAFAARLFDILIGSLPQPRFGSFRSACILGDSEALVRIPMSRDEKRRLFGKLFEAAREIENADRREATLKGMARLIREGFQRLEVPESELAKELLESSRILLEELPSREPWNELDAARD
jgi:hypothetical protein